MTQVASSASATPAVSALLQVRGVSMRFGGIQALQEVSFEVQARSICGIVGPNGAGKTTLFNCLGSLYRPTAGEIVFAGVPIAKRPAHRIAALGLARTFQHTALFPALDVRDNVRVGMHSVTRCGFLTGALRLRRGWVEERRIAEATDAVLEAMSLTALAGRLVGELPFGTRKRVELARALVSRPRMLLLDEPAAGLNHEEVDQLRDTILRIRDEWQAAVLLVEHHMNLVMRTSDQVVALNFGAKIADGTPAEVSANEAVISAYLGGATP